MTTYKPEDIAHLFVAVFVDEQSEEAIEELFDDLEECGIEVVNIFDDGVKVIFSAPMDYPYEKILLLPQDSATEYWADVLNDSINSCCNPTENYTPICAYVLTLDEYIKKDQAEQDGQYESEYKEIVEFASQP